MKRRSHIIFLFFPFLIYTAIWVIPSFSTIPFSFYSIESRPEGWYDFRFVGLSNIIEVFTSRSFYLAIRNNFIFVFFIVLVRNFLALILAIVFFESRIRYARVFNALLFLPVAMAPYMLGLLFRFILNPIQGLFVRINPSLTGFLNPDMIAYTLSSIETFRTLGFPLVTILAGLTSIPIEILESATLDGATGLRRMRHVTVPMIKPVILVLLTLSVLGAFSVFDIWVGVYGSVQAAPQLQVISALIYHTAFFATRGLGPAAAMSFALLLIQLSICLVYFYQLGFFKRSTEG